VDPDAEVRGELGERDDADDLLDHAIRRASVRASSWGPLKASRHSTISGTIRRVELRKLEAARRERGERGEKEFWVDDKGT